MNEPVIHRKKRVEVFNDRKVAAVVLSEKVKPEKIKKSKVKKVKTPPPPPRVRGLPTPPHPDGTREERIKLFLNTLKQDCPLFQQVVPLKIKIHKDLAERYPQIAKHIVRGVLHQYTQDVEYWRCLKVGASRYDLDMQPVDVVIEQHMAMAKSKIFEQLKKRIKPR